MREATRYIPIIGMTPTTMSFEKLPLIFDARTIQIGGEPAYLYWDFKRCPHAIVVGATGSGKTYFVKLLLGRIATHISDAKVVLCDFKNDDFRFLEGFPNHYAFTRCGDGLDYFFEAFQRRQQGENPSRSFRLLVFDEWASYLSMLDKKSAEVAKSKLATLLMLGRSFNYHVLISQQRADASYFATARDQFSNILSLGNLSREGRDMLFSSFKDQIQPVQRLGEGYMLTNGITLYHIKVPHVRDEERLENTIKRLVR